MNEGHDTAQFVKNKVRQHAKKLIGGGSIGLSAGAVVWLFATFSTKSSDQAQWQAIKELQKQNAEILANQNGWFWFRDLMTGNTKTNR